MKAHAAGEFDVTITPLAPYETVEGVVFGRMAVSKQFHGDLEGSSTAEMLSAGTSVKGSAGYVAVERVTGRLHGRAGSFVLQHSGTMTRGQPELAVSVVPDSGAGELAGLAGRLTIDIVDGKHFYGFDYTLAPPPPETP
jgi:Protein of unknown function (DUF3224)